jgi:hypothetical protein
MRPFQGHRSGSKGPGERDKREREREREERRKFNAKTPDTEKALSEKNEIFNVFIPLSFFLRLCVPVAALR